MSENEMLEKLSDLVKTKLHKHRLANPNYRISHFASNQWKCCGRFDYWKFNKRVYAIVDRLNKVYKFCEKGTLAEPTIADNN